MTCGTSGSKQRSLMQHSKSFHDDGFNDDVINYDIAIISYLLAKTTLDLISKLAHNV